jgi:hypothetical protein
MDKERVKALWEYAVQGPNVSEKDLLQFCSMYLGKQIDKDVQDKLAAAITETLSNTVSRNSIDVLDNILKHDSTLFRILGELSPVTTKPKESLRTILDENLGEDDEDDSSVDEVR